MLSKLQLLAVALMALGLIASGCGGDDEAESGNALAPTQAEEPAARGTGRDKARGRTSTAPSATDHKGADDPAGRASWAARATDGCRKNADQYAQGARSGGGDAAALDEYEDKVKDLCEEVGEAISTGDDERLQRVSKEICLAATDPFVKDEGRAHDEAVAQCERSSRTP